MEGQGRKSSYSTHVTVIPQSYYCPITQEIFKDPVIDPDGNSYEREAIEDWLARNSTSPITRRPLTLNDLRPNRALKESIEAFMKQANNPVAPKQAAPQRANVSYELKLAVSASDHQAMISIQPPSGSVRTPCSVVCVVDVSGSTLYQRFSD